MPEPHHTGRSADLPLPAEAEENTPPACGAGSSIGTISGGSKSSENTSTASVSFYTSVDAASRSAVTGTSTSVGRVVSRALAHLGQDESDL